MLNLASTDKITVVTSSGADLDIWSSWVDDLADAFTPNRTPIQVTTATTTDNVVPAPAASTTRNVKGINIRNIDGSVSQDVTVQVNISGTLYTLLKCTLLAGEALILNDAGVWFHYDANGGVYSVALPAASDTASGVIELAVQSEMEAATDVVRAVVPGRQHYHPGMAKFVCMTTGGATPVMQTPPSYNMTSITDAGVGRLTVTIATDFSSANWACMANAEYSSTTLTETSVTAHPHIRSATLAAGTVEINTHDTTATTNVLRDATSLHVVGYGDQ